MKTEMKVRVVERGDAVTRRGGAGEERATGGDNEEGGRGGSGKAVEISENTSRWTRVEDESARWGM